MNTHCVYVHTLASSPDNSPILVQHNEMLVAMGGKLVEPTRLQVRQKCMHNLNMVADALLLQSS